MSQSDDLKRNGPPSLFGSGDAGGEDSNTRILASLEGRVASQAPGKPARHRKRGGIIAGLALAMATAGVLMVWLGADEDVESPTIAAAAGASSAPVATALAAVPTDSGDSAATIVDVNPAGTDGEDELDRLGKAPAGLVAAGAAALAGGDAKGEGKAAADVNTKSASHTPATGNKEARKQEVNKTKFTAVAETGLKRQKSDTKTELASRSGTRASTASKAKTDRTRVASHTGKKGAKRSANGATDPDAELLAALLAPQPGEKTPNSVRSKKAAATPQRTQ